MIRELYYFDWNTTDNQVKQQQKSNSAKLERMWQWETDKIFSTWGNLAAALISTHQLLSDNVLRELFLGARHLVKIASKLILVRIAPRFADQISKWGEEGREPWSFAIIHEEGVERDGYCSAFII
jgi:hypothetical protein